jgi:hypothetical protein
VTSGNGGNGLRVTDSNNTTIQANFFGLWADNNTAVRNAKNGVLVNGPSARTTTGGPIPLGNVSAANGRNGIHVADTASEFVTDNTFAGLAAFSDNPNHGNGKDGMLITASGGKILIRTNVVTATATRNATGDTSEFSPAVAVQAGPDRRVRLLAVWAGAGGGPRIIVYNPDGSVRFDFFAYDSG